MYEGISGNDGLVREGYQNLASAISGNANHGAIAYGVVDVGLSVHGSLRLVLKKDTWSLFGHYGPQDYERAFRQTSSMVMLGNSLVDISTIADTLARSQGGGP